VSLHRWALALLLPTSFQADISIASFSDIEVHARCVRIWIPTGVWTTADGRCVHRTEGVGLNGARRCAHTPA